MQAKTATRAFVHEPTFAELYTPKLVTTLREGYGIANLRADLVAGLTVAVVGASLQAYSAFELVRLQLGKPPVR